MSDNQSCSKYSMVFFCQSNISDKKYTKAFVLENLLNLCNKFYCELQVQPQTAVMPIHWRKLTDAQLEADLPNEKFV